MKTLSLQGKHVQMNEYTYTWRDCWRHMWVRCPKLDENWRL